MRSIQATFSLAPSDFDGSTKLLAGLPGSQANLSTQGPFHYRVIHWSSSMIWGAALPTSSVFMEVLFGHAPDVSSFTTLISRTYWAASLDYGTNAQPTIGLDGMDLPADTRPACQCHVRGGGSWNAASRLFIGIRLGLSGA